MSSSSFRVAAAALVGLAFGAFVDGCSLSNIAETDCTTDAQCAAAFGAGSTCTAGSCSQPMGCTTGHDCRKMLGGGACVNGACVSAFPVDPACKTVVEPPDLLSQPLLGAGAPLVIGSIFSLGGAHDLALTQAVRLAVTEINKGGALNNGQKLGVVFCDNGGPGDTATGATRTALSVHAFDYLAGTLGVPYIVGPLTSSDSLDLINELKAKLYPTVIISPSATSPTLTTVDDHLHAGDPVGMFWRTCPSDQLQAQVLANDVIKPIATIKSVTVIFINDPYGQGLAQLFQQDYGLTSTFLVPFDDTTLASPAALTKLASDADKKGGDAVLIISVSGKVTVQIMEAMGNLPITTKPFFFTDGSKDSALTDPTLPAPLPTILKNAQGTAPASPAGQNYDFFTTSMQSMFGVDASSVSFLAQSYDATYVGAFGTVLASKSGTSYDGLDVAKAMTHLSAGDMVNLNGVTGWTNGKGLLTTKGTINVEGTSGHLDFDPATGEAPGRVALWTIVGGAFVDGVVYPPN